ncbi:MAG: hypothetical protein KF833_12335 [Verrucomicrobiae bacterium]|nr:hypothetical protein [Verrucomicrobiae bacterium]
MKTWLKLVGSQKAPLTEAPWHGSYTEERIGFRKASRPSIQAGDHLFLYAPGGSRRIFALAEALGHPEIDPNYNQNEHGSCRWQLSVRYIMNLPVASGILIDDILCGERDLTLSVRQASHVALLAGESRLAYSKLQEKCSA